MKRFVLPLLLLATPAAAADVTCTIQRETGDEMVYSFARVSRTELVELEVTKNGERVDPVLAAPKWAVVLTEDEGLRMTYLPDPQEKILVDSELVGRKALAEAFRAGRSVGEGFCTFPAPAKPKSRRPLRP